MRRLAATLAALGLAACGGRASEPSRAAVLAGQAIAIKAEAVRLNPADHNQDRVGNFFYAGGLKLTSAQTSRLHGLSDLDVQADGAADRCGKDEGDLLRARVALDATDGRLVGRHRRPTRRRSPVSTASRCRARTTATPRAWR